MDGAGRVVIPKAIREAAGLAPGAPLEITVEGSTVRIEPAPLPVKVEKKGAVVVASTSTSKLTQEGVEAARAALRRGV